MGPSPAPPGLRRIALFILDWTSILINANLAAILILWALAYSVSASRASPKLGLASSSVKDGYLRSDPKSRWFGVYPSRVIVIFLAEMAALTAAFMPL